VVSSSSVFSFDIISKFKVSSSKAATTHSGLPLLFY
jgi:hypothetical protein